MPKTSIVGQIVSEILAQSCSDDSIQAPSEVDLGLNVWQVGLLDVVLLEYLDKSHNFTNVFVMTSSLLNSIVVDLGAGGGTLNWSRVPN